MFWTALPRPRCKGDTRARLIRSVAWPTFVALLLLPSSLLAQPPAGRGGPPVILPDGPGKSDVQSACTTCHGLGQIANSWGNTKAGWEQVFSSMVVLPPGQRDAVAGYLATHFPERPKPPVVTRPGPAKVDIQEWLVPSLGSRPHDPLWSHDGKLWWAGQWANVLGRLDPRTGAMKEVPLKTPRSGPHGLTEDRSGQIWYTGNSAALVGMLDPNTGTVTEYPMPDPAARDPHTPIFDQKGRLWFTLQQANMVARLEPKTGEIELATMPTPRSLPYGMVVSSTGVPFVVLFGTNKVASLSPESMEVREYPLPNAETRPRRIAITSDDVIWYADYARGYLGRLDPQTGAVKEWPSPSGPKSQPYGMAVAKDVIWYSESAVRPNTLVRFDPKTEQFQSWVIPSGGGVVRNMMATPEGNLVLACSGVNRVALVTVK